jgi:hypothetical protein
VTDKELLDLKDRISRISEHYPEFFFAAKSPAGELVWKSSDKTWALGVCQRYIACSTAGDQFEEVERLERRRDAEG